VKELYLGKSQEIISTGKANGATAAVPTTTTKDEGGAA
jgi:hypothetical protein